MIGVDAAVGRDSPKVAIVGAGGIGAYFGAQLRASGLGVLFCVRRPFEVLRIASATTPFEAPVDCLSDPAAVPPEWSSADWVFVGVKVHQTPGIRPWLDRLVGSTSTVVSLQNGIEQQAVLGPLIGGADLVETTVYCGAELQEPGVVRHSGQAQLIVGDHLAGERLQQLFAPTAASVDISADFQTEKWRKLLVNVAANGVTGLTMARLGVVQQPAVAALVSELLQEALPIAHAEGAALDRDDIGTILATLSDPRAGQVAPSMYQDRMAGRPTEYDAIYGAVVRAGQRHGLDTPLHRAFVALLAAAA